MTTHVSEPYLAGDQRELVGELLLGKWCVYLHEWLGEDCDLDTWKLGMLRQAEQAGIEIRFFDIPRKSMTLVGNASSLPTFDQVTDSISAMEYYRWTGRQIGTEMLVKTGKDPYPKLSAPRRA